MSFNVTLAIVSAVYCVLLFLRARYKEKTSTRLRSIVWQLSISLASLAVLIFAFTFSKNVVIAVIVFLIAAGTFSKEKLHSTGQWIENGMWGGILISVPFYLESFPLF